MIKKLVLISLCLLAIGSWSFTAWGQGIQDVRLTIVLTNNTFKIGSSTFIQTTIENLSTNVIYVDISAPKLEHSISFLDQSGKNHYIVPKKSLVFHPREIVAVNPSEKKVEQIFLNFKAEMLPGNYILKDSRIFTSEKKQFTVESNSIKVELRSN